MKLAECKRFMHGITSHNICYLYDVGESIPFDLISSLIRHRLHIVVTKISPRLYLKENNSRKYEKKIKF